MIIATSLNIVTCKNYKCEFFRISDKKEYYKDRSGYCYCENIELDKNGQCIKAAKETE